MRASILTILNSREALIRLNQQALPLHLAFRLLRLQDQLVEPMRRYDEAHMALLAKYGEASDGQIRVLPEKESEFMAELRPLLEEQVTLDFEPISPQELKTINMSVNDMRLLLAWILQDPR